jgi:hypothetical protein
MSFDEYVEMKKNLALLPGYNVSARIDDVIVIGGQKYANVSLVAAIGLHNDYLRKKRMETFEELKNAIACGQTLVWNDPDPIDGNDYVISSIPQIDTINNDDDPRDFIFIIHYNDGYSEAEVFLSEIGYRPKTY